MEEKRVLVCEQVDEACVSVLKAKGFVVDEVKGLSEDELVERVADYDALIVRWQTAVTRRVIEAAPRLKVIGRAGVSIDNIDVDAATERGIIVCNAPTSNIVSAAEQTMGLMLACSRNIAQANSSMHNHEWNPGAFMGHELFEKTLAIIGLGRVGSLVAQRAASFGMHLIGYDPYCSSERASELGVMLYDSIDEILPVADIITVHLPKTPETVGMFGPNEFAAMKDGVILINVARGAIFNEASLADFVAAGKVRAVGIDRYSSEPAIHSPFHEFENAVLTPHLGSATYEAQRRAGLQIASLVSAGLSGSIVPTAVNMTPVPPEVLDIVGPYVPACQMMGSMIAQIADAVPQQVKLTASGAVANADMSILVAGAIKGLLSFKHIGAVTPVNAEAVGSRHGISVETQTGRENMGYSSSVTLLADGIEVTCTVPDASQPARIVSLFGYRLDIAPTTRGLIFKYVDAPGHLGKIGTILGAEGINITTMQIGTEPDSDVAIVYMNIEGEVDMELLQKLEDALPDLEEMWYVKF